jgi:hypothetical protein
MTTADILLLLFCTIDDWLQQHPVPVRPGPQPRCCDSEILTFALARELLGYTAERRFRRVLRADWQHLFPAVPAQSELNRRTRWLWGALEALRQHWYQQLTIAAPDWLTVDTPPLPVKRRKRVRRHEHWDGPGDLHAGFGYCAALDEWCYGCRIATLGPLLAPVPACWALVPAAVNEREAALELLTGAAHGLVLTDKGFAARWMPAQLAEDDLTLLTPGQRKGDAQKPHWLKGFIASQRHRVEDLYNTLKDRFNLDRHRALTVWGVLTRVCAKLAALTLREVWRETGYAVD